MSDKYVPIFYDWIEATQELNAQEKGRLIDAIVLYARGGDWQEQIKGNERYAFPVFKLQVDRAKSISSIRAAARTNNNKTEQKEQTESKPLTITNTRTKTNTKTITKESDTRAKRFTPPTVEEVAAYAGEMNYTGFSAERFIAYYESNGWKVGRNSMKDWRAAVRNWASKDKDKPVGRSEGWHNPALDYNQRDYSGTKPKPERVYMTFDEEE